MALSNDLISQFAKLTAGEKQTNKETTVYGTVVELNGTKYVRIDGSDQLTPVTSTTGIDSDDRVSVMIKNHTATVTGNISNPSATSGTVSVLEGNIKTFDSVLTDGLKATNAEITNLKTETASIKELTTTELTAVKATIGELEAMDATIEGKLTVVEAEVGDLTVKNATITGQLTAAEAKIKELEAEDARIEDLVAENLEATNAEIENLKTSTAEIDSLKAKDVEIENAVAANLKATNAEIDSLKAKDVEIGNAVIENLEVTNAKFDNLGATYANIDFANIGEAAVKKLFSLSGIIKELKTDDAYITGELVGVTIKGDLIEGNTVKADKLVVLGSDGLYYKLNFDGGTFESGETVPTDSLHGSVITAKSITAEKVTVEDLVAFGATIGGFTITDNSIHSGVKTSATNTTQGIFLGAEKGEFAVGDNSNFLRYYYDESSNTYKLEISAATIKMGSSSSKTVQEELDEIRTEAETATSAIDNLVIGGRNFLKYSGAEKTVNRNLDYNLWDTPESGETVTFSVWMKAEKDTSVRVYLNDDSGQGGVSAGLKYNGVDSYSIPFSITTEYAKYEVTGVFNKLDSFSLDRLNSYRMRVYGVEEVTIIGKLAKFEIGTKSTAYTPAPEEADARIDTSIKSVDVEYYLSSSASELSDGSWVTVAPTWEDGKYMWSRTKTTLQNGDVSYTPSENGTCIAGATGATGATGTGIESITEEYYVSTSKTTQAGASWSTTAPTWSSGNYIWTRSKIVYKDPASTVYTTPVCDSSWEAVNEIEIGGRNLLKNSRYVLLYSNNDEIAPISSEILSEGTREFNRVKRTSIDLNPTTLSMYNTIPYSASITDDLIGKTVTLSYLVRSNYDVNVTSMAYVNRVLSDGTTSKHDFASAVVGTEIGSKWTRIYAVTTIPSDCTDISLIRFCPYLISIPSGAIDDFYIDACEWKIEFGNKPTDWTPAPEDTVTALEEFATLTTSNIENLQSQIDGNITTWFYDYEPTTSNIPASDWTSDDLKNQHLGDLFYIIDNDEKSGQVYRWALVSGEYKWIIVEDADVTKALASAAEAKDTADAKRRVFVNTPTPPYDVGDIWSQGSDGDLMVCQTARASGSYVSTDWQKASKYTDDTAVNNLQIGGRNLIPISCISSSYTKTITTTECIELATIDQYGSTHIKINKTYSPGTYTINATYPGELRLVCSIQLPGSTYDQYYDAQGTAYWLCSTYPYTFELTSEAKIGIIPIKDSEGGIPGPIENLKLEIGNKATDWTPAPEDIEDKLASFSDAVTSTIDNLQDQIDGNITTWFYSYEPTDSNVPASDWTTSELKNQHLGDLFYIIDNDDKSGQVYRWALVSGVYKWVLVEDADVTKALADAAKAQDTADAKRRVFVTEPTPPYDIGDIWTQGTDGDIMICTTARTSGSYTSSDWQKASKYTDDSAVDELQIGGRNLAKKSTINYGNVDDNYSVNVTRGMSLVYTADILSDMVGSEAGDIGDEITLSFDIILAEGGTSRALSIYAYQSSGVSIAGSTAVTPTEEWQRFTYTTNVKRYAQGYNTNGTPYTYGEIYIWDTAGTNLYTIRNVKLEKGSKATDWTPAPEDVDEAIKDTQSTIADAEVIIDQLSGTISMLVGTDENGCSLVTQTDTGWVFATGDIKATAEKARDDLATLTEQLGSTDSVVSFLKTSVEDITTKTNYVNIGTYNDETCIELGASDSEYKVLITNTQIMFQVGSATPTRIDSTGLQTENITVENELRQTNEKVTGYWFWSVRENGNYGLSWHSE